jgi:trimeric autotransporter adhesin
MVRKLIVSTLVLAGLVTMAISIPALANQQNSANTLQDSALVIFEAPLSGTEEVPAVDTQASGRAIMVFDPDTMTLYYRVTVTDITNITMAHIHMGAVGVNGPVVFTLFPNGGASFGPEQPVSGSIVLDDDQVNELMSGNYYVNVHTTTNPAGEIRGQIGGFMPPTHFTASLSGDEEVPPVSTQASGDAHFMLDDGAGYRRLHYTLSVSETLTTVTMAHIHTGWPGQNGPVIVTLFNAAGGGVLDPDNPVQDSADITAEQLLHMLTGFTYVNVHTQANPAGEVRGQVSSLWSLHLPMIERGQEQE